MLGKAFQPTATPCRAPAEYWPGRAPATQARLSSLRETPALLEADNKALSPTSFEVMMVRDLAGKFGGAKTFVEQLEEIVPQFYECIGQHVRAYVAPPPRIVQKEMEESDPPVIAAPGSPEAGEVMQAMAGASRTEAGPGDESPALGPGDDRAEGRVAGPDAAG